MSNEIDWKDVMDRPNGLVPRETVKEILEAATGAQVKFLEPDQMCMYNGVYIPETPFSTGLKVNEQEAFDAAMHELLEARGSRNVIALRQAVVTRAIGLRFFLRKHSRCDVHRKSRGINDGTTTPGVS